MYVCVTAARLVLQYYLFLLQLLLSKLKFLLQLWRLPAYRWQLPSNVIEMLDLLAGEVCRA